MFFRDVIGQAALKEKLLQSVRHNRLPHALLFSGGIGVSKMPMALALARYVSCHHPSAEDACGSCPSCLAFDKLEHINLHFSYPIVNRGSKNARSIDYIKEWRQALLKQPDITPVQWAEALKLENQQPMIYVSQSDEIQDDLLLKVAEGEYKIMIIWQPEKMNEAAANKLLKILEEPYPQTLFILITDAEEFLLPTILSRTQRIHFPPIDTTVLATYLQERMGLSVADATDVSRRANGSFVRAMEYISLNEESERCFQSFVSLMRLAWSRDILRLKEWSEMESSTGRESQKRFLQYALRMVRENFMTNFHAPEMVYLNEQERKFAVKFAPFINEKNVIEMNETLAEALQHIEQNVNAKMVFFDLSLKMIMLLKH